MAIGVASGILGQNDTPTAGTSGYGQKTTAPGISSSTPLTAADQQGLAAQQQVLNKLLPGMTPEQQTTYLRSLPPAQADAINNQVSMATNAILNPQTGWETAFQDLALVGSVAGAGLAAGAGLGQAPGPLWPGP